MSAVIEPKVAQTVKTNTVQTSTVDLISQLDK